MPTGIYPRSKEYLIRLKKQGFQKENKMNRGINNPMYGKKGNKAAHWKGGRRQTSYGFILIYKPRHPFCDMHNYVFEHRFIMEQHLGRYLEPKEVVHHINNNRSDNRIENLKLFPNNSAHLFFHWNINTYKEHQSNVHKKINCRF